MVLGMPMTWVPDVAEIFGQEGGIGVGVVAAHHHQAVQFQGGAGLPALLHLLGGVDLIPAGAQHVKAAGVLVMGHHLAGHFQVLIGDDALGSGLEADEDAVGMVLFGRLEESGNDVVAARGRAAGEDDAQAPGLGRPAGPRG